MTTHKKHKPFAMIREFQLADWFTLANAVCGTGALFSMLTYLQTSDVQHIYIACGLIVAALVFMSLTVGLHAGDRKNPYWVASSTLSPISSLLV